MCWITGGYTIHPPIEGLLPPTGIEPTPFQNSASKVAGLQCMASTGLLAKKLYAGFASTIIVKIDRDNVTLILFPDVLNEYFNKKDIVKEFFKKLVELQDALIGLDGSVDVTYSSSRKVVTKITHYENKEDII